MITGNDKAQKNKAIKTAAEIMGLIGKGQIMATQVNVGRQIDEEDQAILDKYSPPNRL